MVGSPPPPAPPRACMSHKEGAAAVISVSFVVVLLAHPQPIPIPPPGAGSPRLRPTVHARAPAHTLTLSAALVFPILSMNYPALSCTLSCVIMRADSARARVRNSSERILARGVAGVAAHSLRQPERSPGIGRLVPARGPGAGRS